MEPIEFWNKKHLKYAQEDFVTKANYLATEISSELVGTERILDLGCGQGQDSLYFAGLGHDVVAVDFSSVALNQFVGPAKSQRITQLVLDTNQCPYPFLDGYFDIIYAHLSLHYFSTTDLSKIVGELVRILRKGGQVHALFNSTNDPEFQTGEEIDSNLFEVNPGDHKMFFSVDMVTRIFGTSFDISKCEFGRGTQKKAEDEYVRLSANRR